MADILNQLYGRIEVTEGDYRIYSSNPMSRLRKISLSAVPLAFVPAGTCDSRFGHSVGAAHLARLLVASSPEFSVLSKEVYFAALFHDLDTAALSHGSAFFQEKVTGVVHEEGALKHLDGTDLGKEVIGQGGDIEIIGKLISGTMKPWSDVINGSIDLDNIDNTLRYAFGMGLVQHLAYDPRDLASYFRMVDGQLALADSAVPLLREWERCRKMTYEFINGPVNLRSGMMMFRALQIAYEHHLLHPLFFHLSDETAIASLWRSNIHGIVYILDRLKSWDFYQEAFSRRYDQDYGILGDREQRSILSDAVAKRLGIKKCQVTAFVGKDKGYKRIHVPLLASDGSLSEYVSDTLQPSWLVRVFIEADLKGSCRKEAVKEAVEDTLGVPA